MAEGRLSKEIRDRAGIKFVHAAADWVIGTCLVLECHIMDTMIDFYDNSVVDAMVDDDIMLYGESIRKQLDIPVANLDEHQSKFFKFIMPQISNKGVQDREYK